MNTLHKLQKNFAAAIMGEESPGNNISSDNVNDNLHNKFHNKLDIDDAIVSATLPVFRRLNIYRNNVNISLRNAIKSVYPVTYKLVGEEFFNAMAKHYIAQHPSRSGNLHDFGNQLPDFIAGFAPAAKLVYLSDVARLEWAYHRVFHAKNGQAFEIEKLQKIDPANYGDLCFMLNPASRLIRSAYPILRIWQANQESTEQSESTNDSSKIISLDEGETILLVLRKDLDIEFLPLSPAEFKFLEAFSQRDSFFVACDKATKVEPECDVGILLQKHILSQTIIDFDIAK